MATGDQRRRGELDRSRAQRLKWFLEDWMSLFESFWAAFTRVVSFVLGVVLLVGQQFFAEKYSWLLVIAGIVCLGPTFTAGMGTLVDAFRGGGSRDGR